MVLAEAVYSHHGNPLNKWGFGEFTFERLIQATLLFIYFQGIALSVKRVCPREGVPCETLSNKKNCISELFPDYQVSSSLTVVQRVR